MSNALRRSAVEGQERMSQFLKIEVQGVCEMTDVTVLSYDRSTYHVEIIENGVITDVKVKH